MYFPLLRPPGQNKPTVVPIPKAWEPDAWHKLVVRVQKQANAVRLLLDDAEIFAGVAFSGLPKSNILRLGCDTGNNELMVRKWEIRSNAGVKVLAYDRDKDPVLGQWKWFNGGLLEVKADGTIQGAPNASWQRPDSTVLGYRFRFESGAAIDDLILSPDGTTLRGKNHDGVDVSGARIR